MPYLPDVDSENQTGGRGGGERLTNTQVLKLDFFDYRCEAVLLD